MHKHLLIALVTLLFISCQKKVAEEDHGHGPEPVTYTVYSDKTELYVEFNRLVAGRASEFAAHFTVLGDQFAPLSDGSVTISLITGAKGIRHTADKSAVPGLYRLALTPAAPGTGQLVFDIRSKSYTDRIIIDSIIIYKDEYAALADQKEKAGDGNEISYLKEQAWKTEFANTLVERVPFSNVIKTNGQVLSAPGDEMIVSAGAGGMVLFSGASTFPGAPVKQGEVLFTIAGGNITGDNIDATFKESKANYVKAKADYERAGELVEDKIISQRDFQEAKRQFENAETEYNIVARNYSSKGQNIPSPMSGFIKSIMVTEGQYVETGTPLAAISKNKKLILRAHVSQKYFDKLPLIRSANFKATNNDSVYSTEELNGKIISYGKSASANFPFIPVVFEIDNNGSLVPGSVVEVYLKSNTVSDALVIPASSLMEEQGKFFVYVQTGGESFQKREVKIAGTDGINVQLLSGVEEGERVVTRGAYQIKLASAAGALPAHGHEH